MCIFIEYEVLKMKKIISCIFLCILFSCDSYQREIKKIINEWSGKEIVFSDLDMKIMGRDTCVLNAVNYKYKILTYIDTIGCTACRLKLFDWNVFLKELKPFSQKVCFLFVIHSNDYDEFEIIQRKNRFFYPVYYDYNGKLKEMNKFPDNPNFQTFLLDKDNKVVVIGNPITNDKVRQIYMNVIQKGL